MQRTIFILGTDPEHCAELQDALRARISDTIVIVTPSMADSIPPLKKSDSIIISDEGRNVGLMYRHLLNRVENQVNRATILGELIRLSMTLSLEDILEKVVAKSTEVLGDTAFIVLELEAKYQLEAGFCADADRLKRLLMTAVNVAPQAVLNDLLRSALDKGEPVVVPDLPQAKLAPELQLFVDKHALRSLIATPIRSKDRVLGAFISMSTAPQMLMNEDLASTTELADFTAMVIENARSATTDPLTGIYNRRLFHEVLNREVARCERYFTTLSLLMIDVDSFKAINDTYGHDVGDTVLVQIGRILEECVRNTDFVFRYGGDEFSIVLPGTSAEGALRVAQKILASMPAADIKSRGHSATTSVSIGIAQHRRNISSGTLVANADHALSDAKRSGKNTVRIFNEDQQGPQS